MNITKSVIFGENAALPQNFSWTSKVTLSMTKKTNLAIQKHEMDSAKLVKTCTIFEKRQNIREIVSHNRKNYLL